MSQTVTVRDHFRRLFDLTGREDRASFWPYAAIVFAIIILAGMLIFVPMMIQAMDAMQQFASQHPDQVTVESGAGHYSISVRGNHPNFVSASTLTLYLGVTFGLAILLYSAAVVRRLRDRGKSGFWGLLPLPFILYSSIQMPRVIAAAGTNSQPDVALFFSVFFSNFLYIVTLIVLIVLLAGPSEATHDG